MFRKKQGITLITLIITIIILLILAGITISTLTGDNGLFKRAQQAKQKTVEGQLREEIVMAIQDIQLEEIAKENGVTLESLAGGQLEDKLKDITVELSDAEITGEYKNYEYTIDPNLNVTINGPLTGIRIKGKAEVQSGYVFEGNTVEIKVTASITEGKITGIESLEGATLKKDVSVAEKVYTVNKNGEYVFNITSDSGKTRKLMAKVKNILSTPQIKVDEVKKDSFKISIENEYPEGAIIEYKYYVENTVKQEGTLEKTFIVRGLSQGTQYSNIKVVAYINENTSKESSKETVVTKDSRVDYAIITENGIMNCKDDDGNYIFDASTNPKARDSLETAAYDKNYNTYASMIRSDSTVHATKYIDVDSKMWNKELKFNFYASDSTNIYIYFYDESNNFMSSKALCESPYGESSGTVTCTIPKGTKKIGLLKYYCGNETRIFEITI